LEIARRCASIRRRAAVGASGCDAGFAAVVPSAREDSRAKTQRLSWADDDVFLASVVPFCTALARVANDYGGATAGTERELLVLI